MGATFQLGAMFGLGRAGGIEKTSLISPTSEERRTRPHMRWKWRRRPRWRSPALRLSTHNGRSACGKGTALCPRSGRCSTATPGSPGVVNRPSFCWGISIHSGRQLVWPTRALRILPMSAAARFRGWKDENLSCGGFSFRLTTTARPILITHNVV